jgi:hypothetical protein
MMSFRSSESIRSVYIEWLSSQEFDLAITVNVNRLLPWYREEQVIRVIDGKLNRHFLGPRYSRLPEPQRVFIVGVAEYKLSGVHFHLAVRIPKSLPLEDKRSATADAIDQLLRTTRHGRRFLPFELAPIPWTSSERWIRCPRWDQARVLDAHAGGSLTSSKPRPFA